MDMDYAPLEGGDDAMADAVGPEPADMAYEPAHAMVGEGQQDEVVEPLAEIEVGGRRHRVPESLKGGFLMHADYTRKTQELAEQRRAFEAERTAFEARSNQGEERRVLAQLEDQLGRFEGLNWEAAAAQDPKMAKAAWDAFTALTHNREALAGRLAEREAAEHRDAMESHAAQLVTGHAVLSRDVPGWSPQLAGEMATFAQKEFGFSRDEIDQVLDPRLIKLLHRAYSGAQREAQVSRLRAGQGTRPAPALRGGTGGFHASADTDDFAAFERMADARLKVR